jgi:CHAT domain-containing protein
MFGLVSQVLIISARPNDTLANMLDAGIEAYNNSEYLLAVDTLNNALIYYFSEDIKDKNQLLLINIYLGMSAFHIGDYYLSLDRLKEAEVIAKELQKSEQYIYRYIYYNIALTYIYIGEYKKGILLLENSLKYEDNLSDSLFVIHEIGMAYYKKGDYQRAIKKFTKIINSPTNKFGYLDYTLFQCAKAYRQIDKKQEALELLKYSLKISRQKYGEMHYEVAMVYEEIGRLLSTNAGHAEGLSYLNKALSIYQQSLPNEHYLLKNCNATIGDYFFYRNNPDSALYYYQQALMPSSGNYFQNPALENRLVDQYYLDLLRNKSLALVKKSEQNNPLNYLQAADQTLQLALKAIHFLRRSYQFQESKLNLGMKEREILELNCQVAIELFNITGHAQYKRKALVLSNKMKYITLTAQINEQRAMEKVLPPEVRQKEENIAIQIASYRKTIMNRQNNAEADSQIISYANRQLFDLYLRQDSLIALIEKKYPHYYRLKYEYGAIDMDSLQSTLPDKTSIVSFSVKDSLLYAFIIDKQNIHLSETTIDSSFFHHMQTYRDLMSLDFLIRDSYKKVAFALYADLVKPLKDHLKEKLIIIPDEKLGYLSFESLLYEKTDHTNMNKWPYMLKKHIISYSYSLTHYYQSVNRSVQGENKLLGVAPKYPAESAFSPIYGDTKAEIEDISSYFDSRLYMGEQATVSELSQNMARYNLAHIAAHGIMDTSRQFTGLMFYPALNDTSILYDYEISNIYLPLKMVVLSSCHSGGGAFVKGEGIMSLGRSFIAAGSKSVVFSIWQSYSDVDKVIYPLFYKYLSKGYDKASALNKAKLKYISRAKPNQASPHKWAGHIIIGNASAIEQKGISWYFYLGPAIILLITGLYFYRRKLRN